MNRDLIQPITLKSVLIFPPTVRLERTKLTQFYATVCGYKPYTQFAFLRRPPCRRKSGEGGRLTETGGVLVSR